MRTRWSRIEALMGDEQPTNGRTRDFAAEQVIVSQGAPSEEVLLIVQGRVKLWRTSEGGAAVSLLVLGAGEVIGALAVAQGSAHPVAATALTATTVHPFPAQAFRDLLLRDPELACQFIEIIAHRAHQLLDRLDDSASASVQVRLARLLIRLAGGIGRHLPDLTTILDIRRSDLAEMAFTTVPTVSRIMSEWERRGLVKGARGRTTILELGSLAAIGELPVD